MVWPRLDAKGASGPLPVARSLALPRTREGLGRRDAYPQGLALHRDRLERHELVGLPGSRIGCATPGRSAYRLASPLVKSYSPLSRRQIGATSRELRHERCVASWGERPSSGASVKSFSRFARCVTWVRQSERYLGRPGLAPDASPASLAAPGLAPVVSRSTRVLAVYCKSSGPRVGHIGVAVGVPARSSGVPAVAALMSRCRWCPRCVLASRCPQEGTVTSPQHKYQEHACGPLEP